MLDYQYYAIFLTGDSKRRLAEVIINRYDGYDYLFEELTKVHCDHCTIMHRSKHNIYVKEELDRHIGDAVIFEVTHIGNNDLAMAVKVSREGSIVQLCTNNTPHITIGTFMYGKPADSNNITTWKQLERPILLVGILKKI